VDKAPDAFRTISEVAEELDVPQHVLRFWESRFKEIRPMKRGGGRRYYRPDDVALLRGIRHLLYGEGYTIRGVQRLLREQGVKFVQAVWQPGAPQPKHGKADDDATPGIADEADAALEEADLPAPPGERGERDRGRGLFGLLPTLLADNRPPPEPDEPVPEPPRARPSQRLVPPLVAPSSLSRDDMRKLQSALHELGECRRLIDTALKGTP
jgi:DNA-binding transcriptional MerR regulator